MTCACIICKFTNTQIHKYTNTQISKYTNTKCLKDPTYAIFLKSMGFEDIKYDIPVCHEGHEDIPACISKFLCISLHFWIFLYISLHFSESVHSSVTFRGGWPHSVIWFFLLPFFGVNPILATPRDVQAGPFNHWTQLWWWFWYVFCGLVGSWMLWVGMKSACAATIQPVLKPSQPTSTLSATYTTSATLEPLLAPFWINWDFQPLYIWIAQYLYLTSTISYMWWELFWRQGWESTCMGHMYRHTAAYARIGNEAANNQSQP